MEQPITRRLERPVDSGSYPTNFVAGCLIGDQKSELESLMEELRQARAKGSATDRIAGKYHDALKNFFQDEMRFTK